MHNNLWSCFRKALAYILVIHLDIFLVFFFSVNFTCHLIIPFIDLPGDPEYTLKDGTTVLGGIIVLSVIQQQSLIIAKRPYIQHINYDFSSHYTIIYLQ